MSFFYLLLIQNYNVRYKIIHNLVIKKIKNLILKTGVWSRSSAASSEMTPDVLYRI